VFDNINRTIEALLKSDLPSDVSGQVSISFATPDAPRAAPIPNFARCGVAWCAGRYVTAGPRGRGPPGHAPLRGGIWQSLKGKPRATLHYTLTVPVDTSLPDTIGPPVLMLNVGGV
jgi:hypothetical protein